MAAKKRKKTEFQPLTAVEEAILENVELFVDREYEPYNATVISVRVVYKGNIIRDASEYIQGDSF